MTSAPKSLCQFVLLAAIAVMAVSAVDADAALYDCSRGCRLSHRACVALARVGDDVTREMCKRDQSACLDMCHHADDVGCTQECGSDTRGCFRDAKRTTSTCRRTCAADEGRRSCGLRCATERRTRQQSCASQAMPCLSACSRGVAACGDGNVDPGEACDGTDDAACPGSCVQAGQQDECTCEPDRNGNGVVECCETGDVFCGSPDGIIEQRNPRTGALIRRLDTGSGTQQAGMCFDGFGNLHSTNFLARTMSKLDTSSDPLAMPTQCGEVIEPSVTEELFKYSPESCVFSSSGNVFAGEVNFGQGTKDEKLYEFDASGVEVNSWVLSLPTDQEEEQGVDWIDLAADQRTILYTAEGDTIHTFDTEVGERGADFATSQDGLVGECFALRILPGSGEVLVACRSRVVRLDSSGNFIANYLASDLEPKAMPPATPFLFALNIDPDGTSFWTADRDLGHVYRIDISSGDQLNHFDCSPRMAGLAVCGERTAREQCGNGTIEAFEQCDDGNTNTMDTCIITTIGCSPAGTGACCVNATCGDGFVCSGSGCTSGPGGGPEECDTPNGTTCDVECGLSDPVCGNGTVEPPETCESDAGCAANEECVAPGETDECTCVTIEPIMCLAFAVEDIGKHDSQLLRADLGGGTTEEFGPLCENCDIEALALDSLDRLFGISGGGGSRDDSPLRRGDLFQLDPLGISSTTSPDEFFDAICNTGASKKEEIVSATIRPGELDILWAFQQRVGLVTVSTADCSLEFQFAVRGLDDQFGEEVGRNWEGLAWDLNGDFLFGSDATRLYRFDPHADSSVRAVHLVCANLTGAEDEVEALEFSPDGQLLAATHDNGVILIEIPESVEQFGPNACVTTVVSDQILPGMTMQNDVESLAFGVCPVP